MRNALPVLFLELETIQWYVRAYKRSLCQEKATERAKRMIIAVDFDGTLCKSEFPSIGEPKYEVISLIRQMIDNGNEVILWTTRNGKELEDAVKWCEDYGLHFCAINDHAPSNKEQYAGMYETESRKVYADVYIDDHNLEYLMYCNNLHMDQYAWFISNLKRGVNKWKQQKEE